MLSRLDDPIVAIATAPGRGAVGIVRVSGNHLGPALFGLRLMAVLGLLLVAWADFTYQECADALGVPVGTVRSRLNRARRKMRTALGADPTLVSDHNGAVTHG